MAQMFHDSNIVRPYGMDPTIDPPAFSLCSLRGDHLVTNYAEPRQLTMPRQLLLASYLKVQTPFQIKVDLEFRVGSSLRFGLCKYTKGVLPAVGNCCSLTCMRS